jgi:aspartate aminotransferase
MRLSDRIQAIEESKTVQYTPLIQQLRAAGKEVINLAVGEPEYDTPPEIIAATKRALDAQETRYSAVGGISELKSRLSRQFDGYDENNIILSNGSKQSLYSIFQVICNPGDQIIIPRPYWVSFSEQVRLAGAKPVFVNTVNHRLDCKAIEEAINPKTRAILLNSPNNPTGAVFPKKDLEQIVRIALTHDLFLISDEAYALFVYDGVEYESVFTFEAVRERLVVIRSFSKSYSMTGFRIGYAAAPNAIVNAMRKFQSHLTGNVCTFAQHGALAALELDNSVIEQRRYDLEKKRDMAYQRASQHFDCLKPQGAFYLFPDISKHLKSGATSEGFAAHLIENAGVAVVPGEAFGTPKHIRISYAVPEDQLIQGFERIAGVL